MAKPSWLLSCTALIHLATMAPMHAQEVDFAALDPSEIETMMESCDVVEGEVRNRDQAGCDQFALFLQVAQAQTVAASQAARSPAANEGQQSLAEYQDEPEDFADGE